MSHPRRIGSARWALALTCVCWASCARAAPASPSDTKPPAPVATKKDVAPRVEPKRDEPPRAKPAAAAPAPSAAPDVQQYCSNVAGSAGLARIARQEKQLHELEQQLEKRVSELDAKRSDLQALIDKYDALVRKADETIVNVYARMKPDAAAAQIANLDEDAAAALLLQLKPKNASAILAEMEASHAALVTKKMSSLSSLGRVGKVQ